MVAVTPLPHDPPKWLRAAGGRRLAVLGADGYIGSHVVQAALAAGASVVAVCIKEPWRLEGVAAEIHMLPDTAWWTEPAWRAISAAAADVDAAALLFYRPPTTTDPEEQRVHERTVNTEGASRIAANLSRAGIRAVFASSADVYGPWHDCAVSELAEPAPGTPYAAEKLEAERRVLGVGDATVLRIATAYGPGENGSRAIPSFTRALSCGERPRVDGDGADIRDYVHVVDVAAAVVNAAFGDTLGGLTLNVGSGVGRSTLEALAAVAAALTAEPSPDFRAATRPPSRLVLDCTAASSALSLAPRHDFDAAVAAEVRWLTSYLEVATLGIEKR